jgi:hypothetical protein
MKRHVQLRVMTQPLPVRKNSRPSLFNVFNPLKPELNPSAQRCLTRSYTGNFAS